jgi:hypothetical protein
MPPEPLAPEESLRRLLNEWDPIGVASVVEDEYDCMLSPLLQRLRDGAGPREIGHFLRRELEDHFGLPPVPGEPEAVAVRVVAWWSPPVGEGDPQAAG